MTHKRIEDIRKENAVRRAVRDAATPGRWNPCSCSLDGPCQHKLGVQVQFCTEGIKARPEDRRFVAYARSDNAAEVIDELLAERDELLKQLSDLDRG